MKLTEILPDPKWELRELINNGLLTKQTFFLGCVSYEDRCKTAIRRLLSFSDEPIPMNFTEIEDDECTHPPWKKKCREKTEQNWKELQEILPKASVRLANQPRKYKISKRAEDFLRLKDDIRRFKGDRFSAGSKLRCILDVSSMPSYFALQLLRALVEDDMIFDLIVLYTKPKNYPYPPEMLKLSPLDKTKPDFLPSFGRVDEKVTWIVGVGFDYDSVKNAERIKDILNVEKVYSIIPFPGYKPEYVFRAMTENAGLIQDKEDLFYAPADNPFKTFRLLCGLVKRNRHFMLSSFGPKPMCLGFGLAAIKMNVPILHVQATNYNPNFSIGEENTLAYWIKYRGNMWGF